jgi:hypothetical protein
MLAKRRPRDTRVNFRVLSAHARHVSNHAAVVSTAEAIRVSAEERMFT